MIILNKAMQIHDVLITIDNFPSQAVCSDTYWALEADYQFSLRGSMDHAQLVSSQGVVGVTPQGAMKVGGANSRYHVRIISSVEKCYPGREETKDDTKTTQ